MRPSILLVEDEPSIVELLSYNLKREGFEVRETGDGEEALLMIRERPPDLVILDWMLPSVSGLEVCRQLRRDPNLQQLPIIMLTARAEEDDRVRALDSGADDYVTKPFSPSEVIARVRAVLRRTRPALSQDRLTYADIEMELDTYRVRRAGRTIHLGPTEFRLLRHFLEKPRRVFSRERLLDAVWGPDISVEPRTVDVHIRRLRKALNSENERDLIRTVRSAGYALEYEDA
ncbi:MAG: phosphate regulon transcriptional regulator PhoB [Alphaproteobacteria bacterium]|jgi:two-component system phosphate regulon response regulator PhoB|nr:phosphate regulon transcriptional regulator PhoB [Alphaproteobacteria bacterium]MDP6238395.1 phosphate regulon transcriptional regulator PhoB [Alphaproteobacteria bacterium]MDP7172618.1 phosphate regulon transcriptional regulator PhoB [Alphaproteobacteria bacterium]MDP7234547.1 phosphate regulon transcriptional regulator PhoB [Alphaproteobacteria bacterium]MDP7486903.1 phosphate regulon transcriptional regulator PhoB [Alphaproteobacteria bacterium]|tara:strand:+ start:22 stop:714 length:693 start_codon:yes stop_codon:yes gene_type:complete